MKHPAPADQAACGDVVPGTICSSKVDLEAAVFPANRGDRRVRTLSLTFSLREFHGNLHPPAPATRSGDPSRGICLQRYQEKSSGPFPQGKGDHPPWTTPYTLRLSIHARMVKDLRSDNLKFHYNVCFHHSGESAIFSESRLNYRCFF